MISIFGWLNRHRAKAAARRQRHTTAWAQDPDADGLRPFQHIARERLDSLLARFGAPAQWSTVRSTPTSPAALRVTAAQLALTAWLYDDTLSFTIGKKGDYLEHWDYESPAALTDEFLIRVEAGIRNAPAPSARSDA